MNTLYLVAGIAVTTSVLEMVLQHLGHSEKVILVKIAGFCVCAYLTLDLWWKLIRFVQSAFYYF